MDVLTLSELEEMTGPEWRGLEVPPPPAHAFERPDWTKGPKEVEGVLLRNVAQLRAQRLESGDAEGARRLEKMDSLVRGFFAGVESGATT